MQREEGEAQPVREWVDRFTWIDPSSAHVNGEELYWEKLTIEDAQKSFRVLKSMRPFLNDTDFQTGEGIRDCRDRLASLKDPEGSPLFNKSDLGFYDLYFGNSRILVSKDGNQYDVTNGRHRLWLAQQNGIKELPVWVEELVETRSVASITKEVSTVSNLELRDIQNEAQEQREQAEEMKGEIEQHKERAEKLEATLRELRAAGQELGSDEIRKAEASTEKAKADTEQHLKEIKDQRDKMLQENKKLADKVNKVNDGRRRADGKVAILKTTFGGASSEFRAQIENVGKALAEELKNLAEAQTDLEDVRRKLEALDV